MKCLEYYPSGRFGNYYTYETRTTNIYEMSNQGLKVCCLNNLNLLSRWFIVVYYQRYRKEEEEQLEESVSDEEYKAYVPVKERRKQQLAKLGRISQVFLILAKIISCENMMLTFTSEQVKTEAQNKSASENEGNDEEPEDLQDVARKANISLLSQHTELKKVALGIHVIINSILMSN